MSNPLDFKFVAPRVVGLPRSKFDLSHSIKTTWNVGELMVIDVIDIIPGDTLDLDINMVARSITPVSPTMDNAFMDIFAFWVPNRLTYFPAFNATDTKKTWEKINGENPDGFWAANSETVAYTYEFLDPVKPQSVLNDVGVPVGAKNFSINPAVLNAYVLIWNRFFRDENLMNPIPVNLDNTFDSFVDTRQFVSFTIYLHLVFQHLKKVVLLKFLWVKLHLFILMLLLVLLIMVLMFKLLVMRLLVIELHLKLVLILILLMLI